VLRDIRDAERTVGAVKSIGAARLMLRASEIRQHVIEGPAGIAELTPMVEIFGLTADIDHAVDRRRTAEHLAARPEHASVGGSRVGLGFVAPIDRRVGKGLAKAERDVNPAVAVLTAGLEQQHPCRRVLTEPRRHRAPRRTGTNDDEIRFDQILSRHHCVFPSRR
jgi:hypothetical protein